MQCQKCNEIDHMRGAKFCHKCGAMLDVAHDAKPIRSPGSLRFAYANSFSEGLAMVIIGGKVGFINKIGQMVIKPQYSQDYYCEGYMGLVREYFSGTIDRYSEGMVTVIVKNNTGRNCACIDRSGNIVIQQPQFRYIGRFSQGMAAVLVGDKWGFIDRLGRIAIAPQFRKAGDFSDGLAVVRLNKGYYAYVDISGRIVLKKTKNMLFNSVEGFPIRRAEFNCAWNFHDGWARVELECPYKKGYIDKQGKFEETKYNRISDFSEGVACFSIAENKKFGYLSKDLNIVIAAQYDSAGEFHEDKAVVSMGNKAGYIDKTGQIIIPCQFDDALPFNEGMAAVKINDKYGYIDSSGAMVISPQFHSIRAFSEGLAAVEQHGKWGFVDKSGNYVF